MRHATARNGDGDNHGAATRLRLSRRDVFGVTTRVTDRGRVTRRVRRNRRSIRLAPEIVTPQLRVPKRIDVEPQAPAVQRDVRVVALRQGREKCGVPRRGRPRVRAPVAARADREDCLCLGKDHRVDGGCDGGGGGGASSSGRRLQTQDFTLDDDAGASSRTRLPPGH